MLVILAMSWQKVRSFLPLALRRRYWWAVLASFVVVGSLVSFSPSLAVGETVGNWLINGLSWIMLAIANLCIGLSIFFLRFFIAIASYNNYIDVDVVQLGWVMVRDVANMFFVVALLVIAFGTILGLEEYEWKKNLVKLILAAIFINFSNLIAQLLIDVAHVFTMTFLNAISATAGGNLINMFKLNEITSMVGVTPGDNSEFNTEIFLGAAVAALFAILAAVSIGSYVVVMMARVVALWALIILSPLAYILGVLPKTKSYAERWWSEFTNHVIVAPIMVFFLWLAFATLGAGNIMTDIQADIPEGNKLKGTSVTLQGSSYVPSNDPNKLSLSKVSTWENMSNFLIAIAFLYAGVKVTQETGAFGSGMVGSAWEFGKRVATIATGYAAGRWLVGKGKEGLTAGAKAAGYRIPLVGGRALGSYVNMAKLRMGKISEARNNKAKQLEDRNKYSRALEEENRTGALTDAEYQAKKQDIITKYGGYSASGTGRVWNKIKSMGIETGGRADKRAEDWKEAAERQKKIVEESYSTSDSRAGQAKLDVNVRLHAVEQRSEAKKSQKMAAKERELMANDEAFQKIEQATFKAKAQAERDQEAIKNVSSGHLEDERVAVGVYKEKASAEQKEFELSELRERRAAEERDKLLVQDSRGSEAVYLQGVLSKQAKAKVDRQIAAGGDYTVAMARTEELRDQVTTARGTAKFDGLQKNLLEMGIGNLATHAGNGMGGLQRIVGDTDFDLSLDPANASAVLGKIFDGLLNTKGLSGAQGIQRIKDLYTDPVTGDDSAANAILMHLRSSLEKSAGEGAAVLAGLLEVKVGKGGKQTVVDGTANAKYVSGRRENALSSARLSGIKGVGLKGMVDVVAGRSRVTTTTAKANLKQLLSSFKANMLESVDTYMRSDLGEVLGNLNAADQKEFQELISKSPHDAGKLLTAVITKVKAEADGLTGAEKAEKDAIIKKLESLSTP